MCGGGGGGGVCVRTCVYVCVCVWGGVSAQQRTFPLAAHACRVTVGLDEADVRLYRRPSILDPMPATALSGKGKKVSMGKAKCPALHFCGGAAWCGFI